MASVANLSIFLNLLLIFNCDLCFDCDFFNNITVRVTPNNTFWADIVKVNGCFQPEHFSVVVSGLKLFDQDTIPYIGDHAVHDLLYLIHLSFLNCHNIKNLSSSAFENLPMLTDLKISDTKITSIEAGTFKDLSSLEFLDLADNKISKIPSDAFGVKPELEYVILTRNKIPAIDNLWFQHCQKLRYLSFNNNNIQIIRNNTFRYTPNLIQLLLDFNEIKSIEETSFHHLKDLDILSMVHNKLVKWDPNVVTENFRVKKLDIRANWLNFLSNDLLNKLSVDVLELSGNPWECACLDRISDWMLQNNVTSKYNDDCRTEPVPQCFDGSYRDSCSGTIDLENTELFLKKLRSFGLRIYPYCANIS